MEEQKNMSSAYSDDGQRHRMRRGEDLHSHPMGELQEPDTGVSITAEFSDHRLRHAERPEEDAEQSAIYEQPNESENASSPPGSIREHQDIMSENIKTSNFKKFGQQYKKPFTVKPQDDLSDGGVSKEAIKSQVTKVSAAACAVVSPPVIVPDTSRSIQTFGMIYERLFQEFKEEVQEEYGQMRGSYMTEYQGNYNQNQVRKEQKIIEMHQAIQSKIDYISEMRQLKGLKNEQLGLFFFRDCDSFTKRVVFNFLKYRFQVYKRNQRLERMTTRDQKKRRMQALFDAWRNYSHRRFLSKLAAKETNFRAELESKILIQHRNKVDSLLLYAAELEDKIKVEQDAREKMTRLYDTSLAQGFQVLNAETQCLSATPLNTEVLIRNNE